MENNNNTKNENLISDEKNNNQLFQKESIIENDNNEEEEVQNDNNIEDMPEEEYDLEKMKEDNDIDNNEENEDNDNNEEMIEINDNNLENEEEQIIIENENENDNDNNQEEEEQINEENNIDEMINEEKEENENSEVNNNINENLEEKELYNNEMEEENENEDTDEKYENPQNQNNNIKIEEYESELNENRTEKSEEKNDEYILNTLARLKREAKSRIKNQYPLNYTENKIIKTDFAEKKPIFKTKNKYINLNITPALDIDINKHLRKNENSSFEIENIKYGINQEGKPIDITSKIYGNEVIAYIIPKKNKAEKNILKDIKGNIIPKNKEGNYIYIFKNEKNNSTKKILIKDFDVQNPELIAKETISEDIHTDNTNNNSYSSLKKNIYNKSNDDIKRILNIDNNYNNRYTPDNLLNYNNLMNIWSQRYGKKSSLYQKINSDLNNAYKKENNDKMVKRTNSILKMNEHIYSSSFTDGNINNDNYKYKFVLSKKYNIPIYYNGIINRKYINPLLKKYPGQLSSNRYNPLLYNRTNKHILFKRNNFTDILRTRMNYSNDIIRANNDRNLSFEKLRFNGNNEGKKFLYSNNRYNYQGRNILKNNLYKNILKRNREKELSKSNDLDNSRNKSYSIINSNIYNAIRNINNKKKKNQLKCSVLSIKANQLIKNFNAKYKKVKNY